MMERELVQLLGGDVQQGGHLVDEGTRTAGAGTVHALVHTALEENDLGVLPAQLDDH